MGGCPLLDHPPVALSLEVACHFKYEAAPSSIGTREAILEDIFSGVV
jgi:hypothetical protein